MHILLPESDNCPSWISGRERMTVESISWSISTKECCQPRLGSNLQPPGLQSEKVGFRGSKLYRYVFMIFLIKMYFSCSPECHHTVQLANYKLLAYIPLFIKCTKNNFYLIKKCHINGLWFCCKILQIEIEQ